MYSDFVFLDRFLFELSCKNTHTHGHTHTHTHTDSNEYPKVVFSKNATIITTNSAGHSNGSHLLCDAMYLHPQNSNIIFAL